MNFWEEISQPPTRHKKMLPLLKDNIEEAVLVPKIVYQCCCCCCCCCCCLGRGVTARKVFRLQVIAACCRTAFRARVFRFCGGVPESMNSKSRKDPGTLYDCMCVCELNN